jgi:maleylacetoacetate isomerase
MKLYGYCRSSAAFRVRIALELKGIAYENAFIHLRKDEQKAASYLILNPTGLVPALEDEGQILIQSMSICEYLDETHPEPPLLPGHPADRARVRALAQIVACDIHPINNLRILRYLKNPLGQDEAAVTAWYNHWILEGFEALERIVSSDGQSEGFCHGDGPTLADLCLVPQVFNARRYDLDMAAFPTIRRIFDSCMELEAFQKAAPEAQPDFEK